MKVYAITDITFDHIAKEIDSISGGTISCRFSYEEDIISKLLTLSADDLADADVLFIHSDQIFHRRPVEWQKSFFNTLLHISSQITDKIVLVSNSISQAFTGNPVKFSSGRSFDTAFLFSEEIHQLLGQPNFFVFDFQAVLANLGEVNFYNYTIGHLYQMPYSKRAIEGLAQILVEQLNWLFTEEKKVIVVDCDNTLWKGVVGEDGVQGIRCDKDAEGIIHYHLQEFLKVKKEEGFLLCICSKNNEEDVEEAFAKKNFPLKPEDFIIRKINWNDKVQNIREIVSELNVGIDSFIFIDDNKFELDLVKSLLPGVTCFEFTEDYSNFLTLTNKFEFKKRKVLQEDKEKTEQYITLQQRKSAEQHFENIDDFIASLEIKMDISLNDLNDLERLSQMTGKTNQFNFNKQEYNPDQLKQFITAGGSLYSLKISDKFGDYGTVGLILIQPSKNKEVILENYLMSCRVLGKKIEYGFLDFVMNDLKKNNLYISSLKFVKTDKNIPAEKFYTKIKNETNYLRTATTVL